MSAPTTLADADVGDKIRLVGTFRDLDGDLTDPTAGTLVIVAGDNTETRIDVADWASDTTGVWTYEYLVPNKPGQFHVWWRSTAGVVVADHATFHVPHPPTPNP